MKTALQMTQSEAPRLRLFIFAQSGVSLAQALNRFYEGRMELSNKAVWLRCAAAIVVLASLQPLWFMQGGVFILESIKQVVYSLGLAACSAVLAQVAWPQLNRAALVKVFLVVGSIVALPLVILSWVVALKL